MSRPSLLTRLGQMTQRSLFDVPRAAPAQTIDPDPDFATPPAIARQEAIQRLQIGVTGIAAMVLLVGLASIIGSQADVTEEAAVPEAAPTTEPAPAPSQANPLADAGVVPDIAAEPAPPPSGAPQPAAGNGNAPSGQ